MFDKLSIVTLARGRMDWVARRQEVLSENIANADTPKFMPSDLKAFNFKEVLGSSQGGVHMVTTNPLHMQTVARDPSVVIRDKKTFETSPNGNGVILDEQLAKMGEAKSSYDTAASLFQKQFRMLRTALGKNGA